MCKYCEGDSITRQDIMTDRYLNAVCIWDENELLIDDGESTSTKINYCPMCGRKLDIKEKKKESEIDE